MSRRGDSSRIRRALEWHRTFLDFTDGDLGKDLLKVATDGVQATLAAQADPDGNPWDPLSDPYARWKGRTYPGQSMGVLHFLMTDPVQVAGFVQISPDRATVQYGVSQEARDEASWFQEGDQSQNRPGRRFWGFTAQSKAEAKTFLDDRFKRTIR